MIWRGVKQPGPSVSAGGDDGEEGGVSEDIMLLNCEQRRKSGQEALNICRTGSQPSLAASQKEAQGSTTCLHVHTQTCTSERGGGGQRL